MRYWWVNQNQTYHHEVQGGYLWSPKRRADGARNPYYETMREVAPGDLIFSFMDTRISAVGIAQSYCQHFPNSGRSGRIPAAWGFPSSDGLLNLTLPKLDIIRRDRLHHARRLRDRRDLGAD